MRFCDEEWCIKPTRGAPCILLSWLAVLAPEVTTSLTSFQKWLESVNVVYVVRISIQRPAYLRDSRFKQPIPIPNAQFCEKSISSIDIVFVVVDLVQLPSDLLPFRESRRR